MILRYELRRQAMATNTESRRRSIFSWGTLARVGLTAAFLFWFYMIWNSTAGLDQQLNANADQFAAVRNLQVEYKNEIQEWKNVLLRSNSRESLDKNWRTFETQYQKVADAARQAVLHRDVRAVDVKMNAFIEAHAANHAQYKISAEILAKNGFNPRLADAQVKGIDRPLLDMLEAADAAMQEEKMNINERLVAKARSQIEQSLVALLFIVLIVVWRPRS